MIYAMSDIHGRYDKYMEMLEKIDFSAEDTLYVLGDMIDRGPDGFSVLLDIASRPNMTALRGNHEVMAVRALPHILRTLYAEDALTRNDANAINLWFQNGGETSLADFLLLDAEQAGTAWNYLLSMPFYREVTAGGRKFVLLHGGLEDFTPDRALEDYDPDGIVWCRPETDTVYYPDKCVVLGHTPTQLLYEAAGQSYMPARFFKTETFIDLDCGCVFPGGRLGCLCLDTMEEFYV